MNIASAFAKYMEDEGFGTRSTDLYIGGAPLDAPNPCWWIITSGGTQDSKNNTGERLKNYVLNVYYRSTDAQDVYDQLQLLEEQINSKDCVQLEDHITVEMTTTLYGSDQDLDAEDRTLGLLEVTINVYQNW
jgi:hypothetical protein